MEINKSILIDRFDNYVAEFNQDDGRILLKKEHTKNVAELSEMIATHIDGINTDLSWTIGMLHDVGRFYQIREYNTFIDADSVDHAELGADKLFCENNIDYLIKKTEATEYEKKIIEYCIRNHNKFSITDTELINGKEYCYVLRDADKIDILRDDCELRLEDMLCASLEEIKASVVSEAVKKQFLEGKAILNCDKKTPVDRLVGHIGMVFDLKYMISREEIKKRGYLARLLEFESYQDETSQWFLQMKKKLEICDLI